MHDVGNQQIFCNSYLLPLHGDIVTCSMPITATVSSPSINDNRRKWAINHWIIRSESLITYDREGGTVIVLVQYIHSSSIHSFFSKKLIHSNLSTLLLLQQTLILIAPKFSREKKSKTWKIKMEVIHWKKWLLVATISVVDSTEEFFFFL